MMTGHSSTMRKPSISTLSARRGVMASVSASTAPREGVGAVLPGEEAVQGLGGLQLHHLPEALGEMRSETSTSPSC